MPTDTLARHKWAADAARLYIGLISRKEATKRGVPHMKDPPYGPELHELHNFSLWLHWYAAGKHGPSPTTWRPRQLAWAWKVTGEFLHGKPKPPPKPPPPPPSSNPPSQWRNAPWCRPHVHISHGLRKNDPVWSSPEILIGRCLSYGVRAIFCQIGSDNPDPDWAENCRRLRDAAGPHGIPVGAWGRADYAPWDKVRADIRSVMPLAGYLADVEGRCLDQQLPEHLYGEFGGSMPLGVIATGGIDDSFGTGAIDAAIRWGDHFDFVGQDYYKAGQGLPLTPDGGENFVYWRSTAKNNGRGFRHLPDASGRWHIPVGMSNAEGCTPMAEQVERFKPYRDAFGWWDGEIIEGYGEWPTYAEIVRG